MLTMLLMLGLCAGAWAEPVTDARLVHAIVAEALHDDESLLYMACAMHNRFLIKGDLRGVYGDKADIGQIDPKLWQKASKAYSMALSEPDVTHGATHWLSDYDLTHCKPSLMAWRFKMVETAYQGQTHYYRESK